MKKRTQIYLMMKRIRKKRMPRLLFTSSALPLILEALDKSIQSGIIIDNKTRSPILSMDRETITPEELGGMWKDKKTGETIYMKKDLYSVMRLCENYDF